MAGAIAAHILPPRFLAAFPQHTLGGGWGRCLLLQDIGVTGQAFQYDPRARLAPA
eukprot:COSAG01_NODE_39479_length_475_cov_709.534574_1_plen_54_part_10